LNSEDAELLETKSIPGHAQEFETAFALSVFPENVRTDMWTDQADPTPAKAVAEVGAQLVERIVDRVTQYAREMMEGTRVEPIPPFHP
jgi:creatinine amidohydrolase